MSELSQFDSNRPHLPVQEVDGLYLDTEWVRLNDPYLNQQILDTVQAGRGDLDPVKKPKENEVEDAAPLDYCAEHDGLDDRLDDIDDVDELKHYLEGMRPGSFDELEAILSVYATRKTYWDSVVWPGGTDDWKLQKASKAASALLATLGELAAAGMPLGFWLTADEEKQLKKVLTVLEQLKEKGGTRHLTRKEAPDLVYDLVMMLIRWWMSATGKDPIFWGPAGGPQATSKGASQFTRFFSVVIRYLPPDLQPTSSKGTPGVGPQANKKRFTRSKARRVQERNFLAWLRRRHGGDAR